ncbi:hypothetical protein GCM10009785_14820 [Brooklawnia cerclae]|uniref:Lipoprotein n=1 Tax=Brooklawnia cerclae TaxID=349934 RepID=A0ABX0SHQ9_9ACTN|nr:hypothetical protein [Brooklawnia cerclae]NIH57947.1 hypothetical protein [Brooklawnia cerclae]
MTRRPIVLGAVALAMTLVLGACTQSPPDAPEPSSLVAERLAQLAEAADGFSKVSVGPEDLDAYALDGSDLKLWHLLDGVEPTTAVSTSGPAVSFDSVDGAAIQQQVETLSAQCQTAGYRVDVEAITPTAFAAELRCGDDSFSGLLTTEPTSVLLNGDPLPDHSGASIEQTWQTVLDQVATLDPSTTIAQLQIDEDDVSLRLADDSATNGCRPALVIAKDGSALTWACWATGTEAAIPLDGLTASGLAATQQAAMSAAGVAGTSGLEVTISTSATREPELRVQQGSQSATVPLR